MKLLQVIRALNKRDKNEDPDTVALEVVREVYGERLDPVELLKWVEFVIAVMKMLGFIK